MRPDDATILDMLNAARQAVAFVTGMNKEAFLEDEKSQSAVLHQLMLLGEAVKRLSETFRSAHSNLDLRPFAGMRDVLIHQYDAVDLDEVWKTIQEDLPGLMKALEAVVPQSPKD